MTSPTRRHVVMGLGALPAAGLPALARADGDFVEDFAIGAEDAPVTVYEYVSYTCRYCGTFHQDIWPRIKEAYVDTGKARFVIRGFYRNTVDLDVGLLARCGGDRNYYALADAYLNTQSDWTRAADIPLAIKRIAKRSGMSQTRIDECLADFEFRKALVERFRENVETHGVRSTPSFVIDGVTHPGLVDFESFSDLIDEAIEAQS